MLLVVNRRSRGWVQCWACGTLFHCERSTANYCSDACRQWAFRRRRKRLPWHFLRDSVTLSRTGIVQHSTHPD